MSLLLEQSYVCLTVCLYMLIVCLHVVYIVITCIARMSLMTCKHTWRLSQIELLFNTLQFTVTVLKVLHASLQISPPIPLTNSPKTSYIHIRTHLDKPPNLYINLLLCGLGFFACKDIYVYAWNISLSLHDRDLKHGLTVTHSMYVRIIMIKSQW